MEKNCNEDAFISASTIIRFDDGMINAHTDSENKNKFAYSHPEIFY